MGNSEMVRSFEISMSFWNLQKVKGNIFRTERGCVLITQQNLQKFEFF